MYIMIGFFIGLIISTFIAGAFYYKVIQSSPDGDRLDTNISGRKVMVKMVLVTIVSIMVLVIGGKYAVAKTSVSTFWTERSGTTLSFYIDGYKKMTISCRNDALFDEVTFYGEDKTRTYSKISYANNVVFGMADDYGNTTISMGEETEDFIKYILINESEVIIGDVVLSVDISNSFGELDNETTKCFKEKYLDQQA